MDYDELLVYLYKLNRRRKVLERLLEAQGYSIKRINGIDYVYVWEMGGGRQVWRYVGRLGEVNLGDVAQERMRRYVEEHQRIVKILDRVREVVDGGDISE